MNLKEFYNNSITKKEYHYRFYELINFDYGLYIDDDSLFEIYDEEEAIKKFKALCQPDVHFNFENKSWFYLITYYLDKKGYILKEFPRILARPPEDPLEFVYHEIRNYIISIGKDDDGIVRYAARRIFVSNFTFKKTSSYLNIKGTLKEKFIEISTRKATFNNMSIDEKLSEITNLIENLLKTGKRFKELNYSKLCFEYITNEKVKKYRQQMQCFRHASKEAIEERKLYSKSQKEFLIDYGIIIINSIDLLLKEEFK